MSCDRYDEIDYVMMSEASPYFNSGITIIEVDYNEVDNCDETGIYIPELEDEFKTHKTKEEIDLENIISKIYEEIAARKREGKSTKRLKERLRKFTNIEHEVVYDAYFRWTE